MEFTGSILFADESSWLTLTTDSDDEVTVKVSFTQINGGETVALTFAVTPNSGVVRLPAGEVLRALIDGGGSAVSGYFQATQGDSSCTHSFKVFPCRKFSYTSLYTAVFCTRPTESPAYEGGKDTLSFYNSTYGSTSAYVRFRYSGGGVSSDYSLYVPVNTLAAAMYTLDVSRDTMLSVAAAKGLATDSIAGYDVWIVYSGSKSDIYSFEVWGRRLPLKTYKFLGRRGTYEYIHATGKFSRSAESETRVFVNSGIEEELENDSVMTFEQNTGHVGSVGMAAYWLEFLASKERYIVEKDGSERRIVVDEHKTTLADREVGSVTFKWHYANPDNTVIDKADVALTGLTVTGEATVSSDGNTAQYGVIYSPSNTTQRGVTWSVVSGADYASIDQNGLLTVLAGASGSSVKIRATSRDNTAVYAEKSLTVTYKAAAVAVTGVTLGRTALSLAVGETETLVATVTPERAADRTVVWSSSAPAVATVDQTGKVTAVSAGSAVISVRTNDGGHTATCALTVAAEVKEYTLTVDCATSGATVKVLEYVSGQSSVADAVTYTGPMTFRENTTVKVWAYKQGMIGSGTQTLLMTSDRTVTVACKTIPSWSLAADASVDSGASSLSYEVSDPDSAGWRLESDSDWITAGTDGVIGVAENTSTDSRSGSVKLVCDAVETGYVAATCAVTQSGAESGASITFESDSVAVPATAGALVVNKFTTSGLNLGTLEVATTGGMTFTAEPYIISSGNELSVACAYAANSGGAARTATVTVTGTRTDGGGTFSKSFTIVQAAGDVALTGLAIESDNVADGKVSGGGVFKAVYTPSDTTQRGVVWSIVSGADYATIDSGGSTGECTVLFSADEAAVGQAVTIRCASTENAAIHADITVTIEEAAVADWSVTGATSLEAVVGDTSQYGIDWGGVAEDEVTWSLENAVNTVSGLVFAEIDSDGLLTIREGWDNVAWPSSRTIGVTATLAGGESKTLEVTIVKNSG